MSGGDAAKIAELEARLAVLEAAVRTGSTGAVAVAESDYPFLNKLTGEDRLAAQTMIQENASLKAKVAELTDIVDQRNYQISHLKRNLEKLVDQRNYQISHLKRNLEKLVQVPK